MEFEELPKNDPLLNHRFRDISPIGVGAQGIVVRGTYRQGLDDSGCTVGEAYALKLILRSKLAGDRNVVFRKQVEREMINSSTLLSHPFIPDYMFGFVSTFFLVLVLEYVECTVARRRVCSFGDLLDRAGTQGLDFRVAGRYSRQLVLGVQYSHKRGVANRDLKPQHCLLYGPFEEGDYGTLKICDWGLSKGNYSSAPGSMVGTPGYWAPEVMMGNNYDAFKADCFSVGVIMFKLYFGGNSLPPMSDMEGDRLLFENGAWSELRGQAQSRMGRRDLVSRQELPCDNPEDFPLEIFEVLQGLLRGRPEERWTMDDVVKTEWFNRGLPKEAKTLNEEVEDPLTPREAAEVRTKMRAIIKEAVELDQHPSASLISSNA